MSDEVLTEKQAAVYELIKNPIPYDIDDLREQTGYKKNLVEKAVQELIDMKLVFQYKSSVTGKNIIAACVDISNERYVDVMKGNFINNSDGHVTPKRQRTIMTQEVEDAIHKVLTEGNLTHEEMAEKVGVSIQTIRRRKAYYKL